MEKIEILRRYGLFDAKVPRYTSYPPANHFQSGEGNRHQTAWLEAVPEGSEVSLYVHIPFCKRLCWFCACRTQGTRTMRPVDAYIDILKRELEAVRNRLPGNVRMARLHLGGGTPTILAPQMMTDLLHTIFDTFATANGFEFSVEIDPTEAAEDLLEVLVQFGMNRASIGVQDFEPKVQEAIGRPQTLEQTTRVADHLRGNGVRSLNLDLLYGLPRQTASSFQKTLVHVAELEPDRLAIYGYAHVPWMSKRQVMIDEDQLPDSIARFRLAEQARQVFVGAGYRPIGIDHFAKPDDSLAVADENGTLRRNFQGYTDETAPTLIGFGASAISRFQQGYVQNAVATSAYQERVSETGFAGHKGYEMSARDNLIARMVEDLMCRFALNEDSLCRDHPDHAEFIHSTLDSLMQRYPDALSIGEKGVAMRDFARPLARVVAKCVDDFSSVGQAHSTAI